MLSNSARTIGFWFLVCWVCEAAWAECESAICIVCASVCVCAAIWYTCFDYGAFVSINETFEAGIICNSLLFSTFSQQIHIYIYI